MDWTLEKNTGNKSRARIKPADKLGINRVVVKMTNDQRKYLGAYCELSGMDMSGLIRTALQEYFQRVDFDYKGGNMEDERQLKIFPES